MEMVSPARDGGGHKGVSGEAYSYLEGLHDGYLRLDAPSRQAILKRIREGALGRSLRKAALSSSSFDLVQFSGGQRPPGELTVATIDALPAEQFSSIRLVEVKGTRGPRDQSLRGLFFSFQYAEQQAAQALGSHYVIVFVVINAPPIPSFHRAMSYSEMWGLARAIHVQFSIQF
jgi:hypothetical protein